MSCAMRHIRARSEPASVEALEPRLLFDAALPGAATDDASPIVRINDGAGQPDRLTAISLLFGPDSPADAADLALRLYAVRAAGGDAEPLLERIAVSPTRFSYDADSGCARWDLAGLDLEPGVYRAVLKAAGVSPGGEPLSGLTGGQTLHLLVAAPGDADLNGRVDLLDLGILEENLGADGASWTMGDFDGDGVVSAWDGDLARAALGQDLLPAWLRDAVDAGEATLLTGASDAAAPAPSAITGADFRARVQADLDAGEMGSVRGDIDALLRAVRAGTHETRYDLDADGRVTQADADLLVRTVVGTEYGDFTLDGKVDTSDLSVLAANWMRTEGGSWITGDATGDGVVGPADLSLLQNAWMRGRTPDGRAPDGHEVVPETDAQRVRAGEFHVWNWINAPGAPEDLTEFGIRPVVKVSWRQIYRPEQYDNWQNLPADPEAIRTFAESIPDGAFVVTDIEGWPLDGDNDAVATERWLRLNALLRAATGGRDIAIGQFNAFRSPRWSILSPKAKQLWLEYNRAHRGPVLDDLDADCSPLYARQPVYDAADPIAAWTEMAENLKALHNEMAPDKPFIPFVSPRWWAKGAGNWGDYLPADLWQAMLDWTEANADGAIVYHGHAASPSWETFSQTEHWAALNQLAGGDMFTGGQQAAPLSGGFAAEDSSLSASAPSEDTRADDDVPVAELDAQVASVSTSDPVAPGISVVADGLESPSGSDTATAHSLDEVSEDSLERLARLGLVSLETL